jgi:hypothetical protein
MNHYFDAPTQHLCGHNEVASFEAGTRKREADRLYYANHICGKCRAAIAEQVTPAAKGFFKIDQPLLVGTERQIAAARSLRLKAMRDFGPVMARLTKASEPFAKLALASLVMLFKITPAAFWIELYKTPVNSSWIVHEIEDMLRAQVRGYSAQNKPSSNSAYAYWKMMDAAVIKNAMPALDGVVHSLGFHVNRSETLQVQQSA